ncbi:MAG: HlyD family efflux transporter periplasmic adaptor subunit [Polyangia bacterium]
MLILLGPIGVLVGMMTKQFAARPRLVLPSMPAVVASALPAAPVVPVAAYTGVILAQDSVDVAALDAGLLVSVAARLGEHVKPGAVLARLDDRAARAELAQAEASLRAARAEAERASLELLQAQERRKRIGATVSEFEAEPGRRDGGLAPYSPVELADAETRERLAAARLAAANESVAEREARVTGTQTACDRLKIVARIAGVVAVRYLSPGATISPGTPILRLVGEAAPIVRFAVPAAQAAEFHVGQTVCVTQAHQPVWPVVVARISPEVDSASRMVLIEALAPRFGGSKLALAGAWHGQEVRVGWCENSAR